MLRGRIYHFIDKKYQKALENYNKAIEWDDKFKDAYSYRAQLYQILGQKQKALADVQKFLQLRKAEKKRK